MDRDWFDEVAHLNARVLAAEVRLTIQITKLRAASAQDQDTSAVAHRLTTCRNDLRLIRLMRDTLLSEIEDKA